MPAPTIATPANHSAPDKKSFKSRDVVERFTISSDVQIAWQIGSATNARAAGVRARRRQAKKAVASDTTSDAVSGKSHGLIEQFQMLAGIE
jgi:hypothetical protein